MLDNYCINELGHLTLGGCDAVKLAERFGTPLYVIETDSIVKKAKDLKQALKKHYRHGEIIYASKALFSGAVAKLFRATGLCIDVVSGGELFVALKAGFPPERIFFNGSNKTSDELRMALDSNVGTIIVDNWHELNKLKELTSELEKRQRIYLRVAPGIEANTHVHIQTGQENSKFGFIKNDLVQAAKTALESSYLSLVGLHCHVGSQITNLESFALAAEAMKRIKEDTEKELPDFVFEELDLGGGLGIQYLPGDPLIDPEEYIKTIFKVLPDPNLKLRIEPGRYLVGEAGTTLYTLGSQKEIPGTKKYLAVDGGMTDNPRVALYNAKYHAVIANRPKDPKKERVSIAGRCCESGDMLIHDIDLPKARPGDILAVFSTGAYNYSMANNYNMLPRPAMVFVSDKKATLVVRKETYEDLILRDLAIEK